ncbi:hypothetical protein M0R45_020932 [Rubus argutus]|uniref:C2 domain-containing protein n=1 Tax=Rubus argutus TaxID=59490 RepID=A0AAW1XC07_RUBAR
MEQRTLELELVSAKGLKDVNFISNMDVYGVVSLYGDGYNGTQHTKTKVVRGCGTHPTFNFPMRFTVDDSLVQQNRLSLGFQLVSERSLGDRNIGGVNVPVKELFDSADTKSMKFVSYQVRRPSGKPKGELSFSYTFGEKVVVPVPDAPKKGEPVMAYPVGNFPATSSGSVYPPPQPGYGYPPPVQQVQPKKKKNNSGMGCGIGLLGGLLGGMLIGDIVSHGGGGCGGGGCGGGCGGGGCGGGCGGGGCGG